MPTQNETVLIPLGTVETIPVRVPYSGGETVAYDGVNVWIDSVGGDFSAMEEGGYLFIESTEELRQIKFIDKANDVVVNPPTGLAIESPFTTPSTGESFSYIPLSKIKNIKIYPNSSDIVVDDITIAYSSPLIEYGSSEMGPAHHPIGPIKIETTTADVVVIILY